MTWTTFTDSRSHWPIGDLLWHPLAVWHSWHVMIVTRDLWRGSSDLRRDQCNGPRRPLTIPCHCLMGPATNFHQTCNTALCCICTSLIPIPTHNNNVTYNITLPVAGSLCSLECSTWISLTPASREQNWNDYIKTSTFAFCLKFNNIWVTQ